MTPEPDRKVSIDARGRVVVSLARFVELLISRRKIERTSRDAAELHDLETNETFVLVEEPRTRAARHGSAK